MSIDGVPIVTEAFPKTVRLVTTARLRAAVLTPLVDDEDELRVLAEIEGATSTRLIAQDHGISGLAANELVYDVPHARFINAAFAYAKPQLPNRYSGADRGAWYAALDVATCLREVGYHLTNALADAGDYNATVEYAEMFCSLAGEFLDLRQVPDHPSLDPDKGKAYPIGNALADRARAAGLNGIIYPSVRRAGGTCLVALRPAAVQSVRQGGVYRMTWKGDPTPTIEGPL
ncbi:RES family NAD+ phosphorylase [Pseudaminobacter soli (ex Li et al. 2025)]|uniref:RES domain-containing protein n=1 Tax=Pseudaminobacter soli (ex Li et al. 2025) TaxID=1295366 RepID=A0A2P7S3L3_9HYPH|nr:RES family NAD+ phosphorylase [Mesorhizobium soli]PSJ57068.1 RES domain-containing protein [Mesorhizobium soli]